MSNRYSRHELIPDWKQKSLSEATVIIFGLGALGNEVARILAMSGVGNFILCDPDRVEESNLSRTILFSHSDLGRFKVEAAADALWELNPSVSVDVRSQLQIHGVGLGEIRDASLILSCLDSRSARLQLTGRCQLVKAPYIDGGTHFWGGEVIPFLKSSWRDKKYFLLIKKAQTLVFTVPCSLTSPKSLIIFENWYYLATYRTLSPKISNRRRDRLLPRLACR